MATQFDIPTVIAVLAIAVILFLAIRYIVREKRKGVHCICCLMAGACTEAYKQMEADMRKCLKHTVE